MILRLKSMNLEKQRKTKQHDDAKEINALKTELRQRLKTTKLESFEHCVINVEKNAFSKKDINSIRR